MGRLNNVPVFGIVFLAVLGLAAAASSPSPSSSPSKAPVASTEGEAPITDDQIGTTDDQSAASPGDGDVAVAGPLGSDSSYGSNAPSGSIDSAESGAASFGVSAVVVSLASVAGSFLFF